MLGVDYPGLAYYQLSGEQIVAERQRNAAKAAGKATEKDRAEGADGISQEEVPRLDDTLRYYEELCREFADYSFQLGDRETGSGKDSGKLWMGFSTDMTQIGDDYSDLGQVSIEIDIATVRRMQTDPEFEKRVKSTIRQIGDNYEQYQQEALKSRHQYTVVQIYDENGSIRISQICSDHPFKTEAEAMEEEDIWKIYWEAYFDKLKNDMLEDFFVRAIDNPREKRLKEQMEHRDDDALFSEKPLEASDDWRESEGLAGVIRDRQGELEGMPENSRERLAEFEDLAGNLGN